MPLADPSLPPVPSYGEPGVNFPWFLVPQCLRSVHNGRQVNKPIWPYICYRRCGDISTIAVASTGVSLSATRCGTKARPNGVRRGHRCLFDELLGASDLGLDVFTAVHGF